MSDFGTRLKSSRKLLGITQKELAVSLDIAQSTIANYENNTRFPGEPILRQLSDLLNVSIDYLLGISDSTAIDIRESQKYSGHVFDGDFIKLQEEIIEMLLTGNENGATKLILDVNHSIDTPLKLIESLFIPILRTVGTHWEKGKVTIAEEHLISNIVDRWLTLTTNMRPDIPKTKSAVFMVPSGEEHVLILKMIREYFRYYNWRTYYLGNSVPLSSLSAFIENMNIDLIVLSISIRSHLNSAENLIAALRSLPLKKHPKILVGGSAIENADQAYHFLKADYYIKSIDQIHDFMIDYTR